MSKSKPLATDKKKKSFILYLDFLSVIEDMTDEQAGILFKRIYHFQHTGELLSVPPELHFLMKQLVAQFKRDGVKYLDVCAKRSVAGRKGAKQKLANAGKRKHKLANLADSDSDSDSENKHIGLYTDDFLEFWNAYPIKVGKGISFKIWKKEKGKPPIKEMVRIVAAHSHSVQWTKDGGKYRPNPKRWLEERRWEDSLDSTEQKKPTASAPSAGFRVTNQVYRNGEAVSVNGEGETVVEYRKRMAVAS